MQGRKEIVEGAYVAEDWRGVRLETDLVDATTGKVWLKRAVN